MHLVPAMSAKDAVILQVVANTNRDDITNGANPTGWHHFF